jgi:hypothetical protein
MKKIDYQPIIFGTLCEKNRRIDQGLARRIRKAVGESVLLPFAVERRHLKNVVLTMRLMDIEGLVVSGSHRKSILKHIPKLDRSARKARMVDTIARRRGTFVGYCAEEMAHSEWRDKPVRKGSGRGRRPTTKLARRAQDLRVELLTSHLNLK